MQINLEQKKLTKSRSAEYQDIKKPTQTLKSLRKSVTLGNISNNAEINLSFKKKQKPSIYKSMKITQSKEIIWESDSSGDLNRILRKQIPIKKHKNKQPSQEQIKQITEQKTAEKQNNKQEHQQNCIAYSDEEEIQIQLQGRMQFSNQDRIDLQNQLSKLLFSDNTQSKPQVTKLQPPQMLNDDFLQQAQQMQIHSDEDEDQDQDEDLGEMKKQISNQQLRSSFDLRQSIGKSRGAFVVPTLIMPTKDFQNFDEEQEQDQQDEQFESLN